MATESASLQVKFTNGTDTKTVTYNDISVNSTDEEINNFVQFLGRLQAGAQVISKVKIIKREIE